MCMDTRFSHRPVRCRLNWTGQFGCCQRSKNDQFGRLRTLATFDNDSDAVIIFQSGSLAWQTKKWESRLVRNCRNGIWWPSELVLTGPKWTSLTTCDTRFPLSIISGEEKREQEEQLPSNSIDNHILISISILSIWPETVSVEHGGPWVRIFPSLFLLGWGKNDGNRATSFKPFFHFQ